MNGFIDNGLGFFIDNFPSWKAMAIGGPLGLAWSFAALWFAGRLKRKGTRTGYTRKIFHYRVRSLSSVPATRSIEGSAAVCIMSAVALVLATAVSPAITLSPFGFLKLLAIAGASTLAEAVSPHGWDNATMQVVPTALVWLWMM